MKNVRIVCLSLISVFLQVNCKPSSSTNFLQNEKSLTGYDTLMSYFKERQKTSLSATATKIFVLTENGCMPCNKKFMELLKLNLKNPNSLFIIGAAGNYFDVFEFSGLTNVFIDQSLTETEYSILHQSKVIYLKGNKIDTVITITAKGIEEQFEVINNRP